MILKKIVKIHSFIGATILNFFLILILSNISFFVIFLIRDYFRELPVQGKYEEINFDNYYPEFNRTERDLLFTETWSRELIYEPFTQFTEQEYNGKYLNIDKKGYRESSNNYELQKGIHKKNIFMIGGSTTFGYGVKDSNTISSFLQNDLRNRVQEEINVYNFGRSFYYSSQERILIQKLIMEKYIPGIVIFIDGLNEFIHKNDEPIYSSTIRNSFFSQKKKPEFNLLSLFNNTSIKRALDYFNKRSSPSTASNYDNNNYFDFKSVYLRFLENKKLTQAVLNTYRINSLFVWQPISSYKYDQKYHPFSNKGYGIHKYSAEGYKNFNNYLKVHKQDSNFLWLADMQEKETRSLYIDLVHYSPYMNQMIATKIADHLLNLKMLN